MAAGSVRSYLESVLFRNDIESSLRGAPAPAATDWKSARDAHLNAGLLSSGDVSWVTRAYGLLSRVLHAGRNISTGEVWFLLKFVEYVRLRLVGQDEPTALKTAFATEGL